MISSSFLVTAVAAIASVAPDALARLREQDLRVARIAFSLATRNADWCPAKSGWTGLVLHDLSQYGPAHRTQIAATFGLGDRPAVEAVVPASPAAESGVRPGDVVVAVNGAPVLNGPAGHVASYDRMLQLLDMLRRAGTNPIRLTTQRGTRDIRPAPGCASDVQMETGGGVNASADGDMISITFRAAETLDDDDELAVIVAHELAHNILRHRIRLKAAPASAIRRAEEQADQLGLYLMARAGYDPAVAASVWRRLGRRAALGLFTGPTHPGWRRRAQNAAATAAAIRAARGRGEPLRPPFPLEPEGF